MVQTMSDNELDQFLNGMEKTIAQAVDKLPGHQDFIDRYCKANKPI